MLSYPEEVYSYMRALAAASPRVEVFTIGESEEGREMILVVVGSEESIAGLDANKAALRALADPRITTPEQAEEIIASAKPVYWSTGAIHSPETGSPEMFMELAYRLAVGESDFIREIRDGVIYMITPIIEVDGRAKVVDLHMGKRKDPDANLPTRPLYWGKYVAHDNNRDNIGQALALSRAVTETYLDYRPTVFHDHHESASHLYTSTGRGPYNAWLDPIVINEWNRLAYKEVQDMTAFGVPGVYTHDFYDGWGANYMMWVAHMRNSIGRFYETQGAGDASTRIIRSNVERQWHRPSTPLGEVVWGIRNNVNLQQSAVLIAMHEVATNGEEFLRNFHAKSQRSVAKAHNEGPAAYVLPADDPRRGQQARLLELMEDHGFEVHRADDEIEIGETVFSEGSYVVRMDQPFSRGADMLLDKQYYNPDDPRPYDDVGWTVGPLFNAQTVRVEDTEILDADMTLVESVAVAGGVEGGRGGTYLINYNADNTLAAFRFAHDDLVIHAAEASFTDDDREFNAGTFVIRESDHPEVDLGIILEEAGAEYGFTAYRTRSEPEVALHETRTPRIAVLHTWMNTQDEGWLRVGLDEYGIPYHYISVHNVRDNPHLRDSYDVIVMGQQRGDAMGLVRGLQGDDPIPWKATEITPNIGRQASTDDMRGGLGLEGVLHLKGIRRRGRGVRHDGGSLEPADPLRPGRRRLDPPDPRPVGARRRLRDPGHRPGEPDRLRLRRPRRGLQHGPGVPGRRRGRRFRSLLRRRRRQFPEPRPRRHHRPADRPRRRGRGRRRAGKSSRPGRGRRGGLPRRTGGRRQPGRRLLLRPRHRPHPGGDALRPPRRRPADQRRSEERPGAGQRPGGRQRAAGRRPCRDVLLQPLPGAHTLTAPTRCSSTRSCTTTPSRGRRRR